MAFSVFFPLIAESYDTFYRAIGLSNGGAIGRLASAASPFLLLPMFR